MVWKASFFALVKHSASRDGQNLVIKKGPFSPFFYCFWQEQDGHFAFVLSSFGFAHVVSPGMGSRPTSQVSYVGSLRGSIGFSMVLWHLLKSRKVNCLLAHQQERKDDG